MVVCCQVWFGHFKIVKLLFDRHVDPNARNQRKNTALHFAYEKGGGVCLSAFTKDDIRDKGYAVNA